MLGAKNAAATIPVKDLQSAKKFYEGTVGNILAPVSE